METRIPQPRSNAIRLRSLFLLTFVLSALLPAALLAVWVFHSQMAREFENAEQKQLALAKTFAMALDRYAEDRLVLFSQWADAYFSNNISIPAINAAYKSGFLYFVTIDADGRSKVLQINNHLDKKSQHNFFEPIYGISSPEATFGLSGPYALSSPDGTPALFFRGAARTLPPQLAEALMSYASAEPAFTPVIRDHRGKPTMFLAQRGPNGRIIAGALTMAPLVSMQQSVSFGIHGHAVIVDEQGRTLAHPRKEWTASMKPLTGMLPVEKAIAGETGAMRFFASARGEDAIAGYTQTQTAGWGVLMVRPLAEIDLAAWHNVRIAITVIAAGAVVAFLIAWFMAGVIVRPVESAAATARELGNGRLSARVDPLPAMPAELRELAATLNQMAERIDNWRRTAAETLSTVRAADQAKRDFMATLSHEIRTPLNAIIGFGELIIMTSGPGEQDAKHRDYANSIVTAGRHLLHLIDDILDLAAIEAGHFTIETQAVDLRGVLDECAVLLDHSSKSRDVTLAIDLPPDLPPVVTDPAKLRQVILNLAGNGLKFTPDGGEVRLSAAVVPGNKVALRISDNGIGIAADEIRTALAPFGRIRNTRTKAEKGTGLGLPLARRLIETMNGDFALESAPGHGTTITIHLPVATT